MDINIQTGRIFMSLFESKLTTIAGKKDLKCSRGYKCAVSFMHLELRRDLKEDSMRVGESKVGFKYRIADKINALLRVVML